MSPSGWHHPGNKSHSQSNRDCNLGIGPRRTILALIAASWAPTDYRRPPPTAIFMAAQSMQRQKEGCVRSVAFAGMYFGQL